VFAGRNRFIYWLAAKALVVKLVFCTAHGYDKC